jgi:hypothetical protein
MAQWSSGKCLFWVQVLAWHFAGGQGFEPTLVQLLIEVTGLPFFGWRV